MDLKEIRTHIREELTPDPREKGKFICPICGSGSEPGKGHDGALSIDHDGIHVKCFSESCNFYGDIIDFVAARDGISTSEATKLLLNKYNGAAAVFTAIPEEKDSPQQHDFSEYLKTCHSNLKGSPGEKYLRSRGLTEETLNRFNLGYDQKLGAIVMPHDRRCSYYTTRSISDKKYRKPAGIPATLFNAAALYQQQPCFIVESQLCAISIVQEGGSALALAGTTGQNILLKLIEKQKPSAMLILALDNDQPGQEGQQKLAEELNKRHIPYVDYNVAGECKDPNELLMKSPADLYQNVAAATAFAEAFRDEAIRQEREDYMSLTASAAFDDFEQYLDANAGRPPVPTGFESLDKILNGGLTAGLYIMGAISSLGKTSWMLNIADNIAAAGRDVLYFSLEMSRHELMAKSISRISFQLAGKNDRPLGEAFSTFEVLNSRGAVSMAPGQASALREAMKSYRETIGRHLWIHSGVSSISADDITQIVQDHIRITGNTPVVFIDYLQILAPEDARSTDKQNTDRAVVKLKNMSATHDIPVFCISSLNRSNYSEPINMAAFKESGAIEYGSDVLIGLQIYGLRRNPGESQAAYKKRIQQLIEKAEINPQTEIEVRVLKNRNGQRGGSGKLVFDKKYNAFHDVPAGFTTIYRDETEEDENGLPVL